MRVLVIARPWSFHGGVETATAGLLRALVEHGDEVHTLTTGAAPPVPGLTVRRLRVAPLPAPARVLATAALARLAVRRGSWDVVQSHERTLGQDVYRAGEGCHRAYLALREDRAGRPLYHRAVLSLERRVFRTTPQIVAIARAGKTEIETLYEVAPARVTVVYNGVDLARFHPDNRARFAAAARSEAGLPVGACTLLFVGSGFARKGLGTAIEALAALDDRGARLLVLGRGDPTPYRALATRLGVDERVRWLGARPDAERWYAAADVLVLPARYEPFGNVHLEALASGTPVVTSTRSGGAEVVEEGVTGAVREPDDVRGFAAAVAALRARDRTERIALARRAAEPFTYARQVRELRAVWARLPRKR
jgi:UDP-glucose:(heptosyl)LPS alpha-1,3-glucosyltransferase